MLSHKQIAIIFILAAIPFAFYTILRPDLVGYDSYAFYSQACGKFTLQGTPLLADFVLKNIPCNIYAIKGMLFLLFYATLLGIGSLGTLFHKKKGYLAALFSFLAPTLFFHAIRLENDQLAYPILIWATYFYYKSRLTKQKKYDLYALGLVILAAGFWQGAIYFLIAFAITSIIFTIPAITTITIYWKQLINQTIPNAKVNEAQSIIGLSHIFGLAFGFAMLPTILYPQTMIFLILLLLRQKFAWMITPLLSIGILMFYVNPKLDKTKWTSFAKSVLISAAICCMVAWGLSVSEQAPHSHTWNAIDYALEQTDDNVLQNDWDLGYFIMYKNGIPLQYGGGKQFEFKKGIGITKFDQNNCVTLKEFDDLNVVECVSPTHSAN